MSPIAPKYARENSRFRICESSEPRPDDRAVVMLAGPVLFVIVAILAIVLRWLLR